MNYKADTHFTISGYVNGSTSKKDHTFYVRAESFKKAFEQVLVNFDTYSYIMTAFGTEHSGLTFTLEEVKIRKEK